VELRKKIENHFDYMWKFDKNIAFRDHSDLNNYNQLPEEVQSTIVKDFLFQDFLESFKRHFSFPKLYNRF